jgi:dUTP pyrophosphatase
MKFLKIRDVKSPTRGTAKSAGIDLYIPNDFVETTLLPGQSILIPAGLKVNIPENYAFIAFNKSGVATKRHLVVGACVIDEDYQGEIHIHIFNHSNTESVNLHAGEKIIQCVLIPVKYESIEMVESEEDLWNGEVTERGEGGFGSTGIK